MSISLWLILVGPLGCLSSTIESQEKDVVLNMKLEISRHTRTHLIHKCVNVLLDELIDVQLSGFVVTTADGAKI